MDTSILWSITPDRASADLLKTIRATGVESVAVPWTVMEELAAQRALKHKAKYDAAYAAVEALRTNTPWGLPTQLPDYEPERVRQHERDSFAAIVDVLPQSAQVLQEAAFREANVLAPCKQLEMKAGKKPVKTGARDAAIWLTAVEYARDHPDETVYFISKNTDDFGHGTSYAEPMGSDLKGLEGRFKHYTSLDPVVAQFTQPTEVDEAAVQARLGVPPAAATIAREALCRWAFDVADTSTVAFFGSLWPEMNADGTNGPSERAALRGWLVAPTAHLGPVNDVCAYQSGGHVWYTATVRWVLTGLALNVTEPRISRVACSWETGVLLSTTNADSQITVLRSESPKPIPVADFQGLGDPLAAPLPDSANSSMENVWRRVAEVRTGTGPELTGMEAIAALVALGVTSYTSLRRDRSDA
ncbi:PIN domain-containing protein [Streptomyces sp. NPDC046860]|uniref:PIN domain-containing protein n=1 Tax=Streptomyces sp. NPDC046860 TaxID=3154495 RepID=UPI0033F667C8